MTTFGIKMNTQKGMTANPMIRKAICYAFDYETLIDVYEGHAVLEDSPFPMATKGHVDLSQWIYRQDLAKAKEFMARAGYPDGGFELEYVYVAGMVERGSKPETSPDMMAVFTTPISSGTGTQHLRLGCPGQDVRRDPADRPLRCPRGFRDALQPPVGTTGLRAGVPVLPGADDLGDRHVHPVY